MTIPIDLRLASLEKELAEMLDPLDIPGSWTGRELNAYEARRPALRRRINTIGDGVAQLSRLPALAPYEKWREDLLVWRKSLEAELAATSVPHTPVEFGKRRNLELSIRAISWELPEDTGYSIETLRLGALMRDAGYSEEPSSEGRRPALPWLGCLPAIDATIATLRLRRDEIEAMLTQASLTDAEREEAAREEKARVDARNARPQRKTRADGSQYDKYPDGRRVEVDLDAEFLAQSKLAASRAEVSS